MSIELLLTILIVIPLIIFAATGLHRSYLVAQMLRLKHLGLLQDPEAPSIAKGEWPYVTVQLPLYNEKFVAKRLIDAVAALNYPKERLEIQILDDSTDETVDIVAPLVERYCAEGVDIVHIHRTERIGYKAGALAEGLRASKGEFIAIFDADFVPGKQFLRKTIPYFFLSQSPYCRDNRKNASNSEAKEIGMVQGRWEHMNRDANFLTQLQAILLDAHFTVEHLVRNRLGRFFNFNGTAGIWRKSTIISAGGWSSDTLTEDLDLSYRAQRIGWKFIYLNDVTVPAELPTTLRAFKTQQHRWVKGSIQTARKQIRPILQSPLPFATKIEAIFHLLGNIAFPFVLLFVILLPLWVATRNSFGIPWYIFDLPFGISTLFFGTFYVISECYLRRPLKTYLYLPFTFPLGAGLSVSNTIALLEGFSNIQTPFIRTPKFAEPTDSLAKSAKADYRDKADKGKIFGLKRQSWDRSSVTIEFLLGAWSLFGLGLTQWIQDAPGPYWIPLNILFGWTFFWFSFKS